MYPTPQHQVVLQVIYTEICIPMTVIEARPRTRLVENRTLPGRRKSCASRAGKLRVAELKCMNHVCQSSERCLAYMLRGMLAYGSTSADDWTRKDRPSAPVPPARAAAVPSRKRSSAAPADHLKALMYELCFTSIQNIAVGSARVRSASSNTFALSRQLLREVLRPQVLSNFCTSRVVTQPVPYIHILSKCQSLKCCKAMPACPPVPSASTSPPANQTVMT